MAIAITPFKGLCGFRPLDEISHFLQTIPELGQIVSKERTSRLIAASSESDKKAALKECFAALMNADNALIKDSLAALIKRYESQADEKETDLAELVQDLNRQYPNDVGVFCVFYLNVVTLDVGEAMFLCADEPHAYISGGALAAPFLICPLACADWMQLR